MVNQGKRSQIQKFEDWYGNGEGGGAPTLVQWEKVLSLPADEPITLINFFKLRHVARYQTALPTQGRSGMEAFNLYAAVSVPTMERAGGSFLHVGPYAGTFLGEENDWDIIAIGKYPNLDAFLALYSDEGYRKVFPHRVAACERQKVLICTQGG